MTKFVDPTGEGPLDWLYTGLWNPPPDVAAAANEAAGDYYLNNAAETHAALEAIGPAGDAVSATLALVEGPGLQNALQPAAQPAGGPGAGLPIAPGVPIALPAAAPNPPMNAPGAPNPAAGPNPPAAPAAQQFTQFVQEWGPTIIVVAGLAASFGAGGVPDDPGEPGDPLDWNDFGNEGANMPGDANVGDLLDHAAEADALLAEKEQLSQQIFQALFDGDEQLALELTEMFNSVVGQIGMLPGNN